MSHWAEIDKDNKVTRVLVGDNNQSDEGEAFMNSLGGTWIKTSFNANIRGKFAAIGDIYDKEQDVFVAQLDPKIEKIKQENAIKVTQRKVLISRLGLTEEEAKILLGSN